MKNLRKLINNKSKPLVIPGVYDAISAKIAQKVGFVSNRIWNISINVRYARLWIHRCHRDNR